MTRAPRSAIVLTAGLGTRLRPLVYARAKPAIPVAGVPMIHRIMSWLAAAHVAEVVLNLHYLPDTLTRFVGDGADLGVRVRYSWEPTILGSAGGPKRALPLLDDDRFFVVNGDTLTDIDPAVVAAAHDEYAARGALVTLAVVPNREPDRYGGVLVGADGAVEGFVRRGAIAAASFHFVGVQVADRAAFADVADGTAAASIGGVYDRLIAERPGSVRAVVCSGAFHDIGTPADYVRASQALAASSAADAIGARAEIAPSARIARSILWDDVTVGERCDLEDCIVTDGVTIAPGSVHRSVAIVQRPGTSEIVTEPIEPTARSGR
jgi:NDP-sugar pyrophosphorylase family protein